MDRCPDLCLLIQIFLLNISVEMRLIRLHAWQLLNPGCRDSRRDPHTTLVVIKFTLMMTGHEQILRNNMIFGAAISIILNVLPIPNIGATGAAIATAVSLSLQMLAAVGLVRWKLGIMTIPVIILPARASKG